MKFPIEMFKLREEDMKIQVPCERCLEKGIIDHTCSKCGGKGVHSNTIKVWKVAPKTVIICQFYTQIKSVFNCLQKMMTILR